MFDTLEGLSAEGELALAYTPRLLRDPMRTCLALDQRIARIVAATSEPMLGQMRLAWWRDMLLSDRKSRPSGDIVLDAIGLHWAGHESALLEMVDGWEVLLASGTLDGEAVRKVSIGRSAPLVELFGSDEALIPRIKEAAQRYVLADIASRLSESEEREQAIRVGQALGEKRTLLPREARGLAVLEALALRALDRGGRPLMEGRGAGLVAIRAGLFGR